MASAISPVGFCYLKLTSNAVGLSKKYTFIKFPQYSAISSPCGPCPSNRATKIPYADCVVNKLSWHSLGDNCLGSSPGNTHDDIQNWWSSHATISEFRFFGRVKSKETGAFAKTLPKWSVSLISKLAVIGYSKSNYEVPSSNPSVFLVKQFPISIKNMVIIIICHLRDKLRKKKMRS